jgi:hypothetical protein
MYNLLDVSTAAVPTGVPSQRKLLKIEEGPYAGRVFCLYNESPSTIAITWADPPYTIWSSPYNHVTDSADYPPSACIDSQGNIYVVYVQRTTLNLIFFKLPFSAGMWASGFPYTVLDVGSAFYPVLARNNDGDLWCAFAYYDSGADRYRIRVKSSSDGGQTWGSGPSDLGSEVSAESVDMPYVNLSFAGTNLYAVYTENRSNLFVRKYVTGWEIVQLVYNGNYIGAEFDCAISDDMKLGIAFTPTAAARVYYREYDGINLGGLQEVYDKLSRSPQLFYIINRPYILFAESVGNDLYLPKYATQKDGMFSTGDLARGVGFFDTVFLYENSYQTYEDKTEEAGSTGAGDTYHTASNALLSSIGDCAYFGMEERFFCVAVTLATSGSGGSVVWEYHDGLNWHLFSPQAGHSNFNEVSTIIYLWIDLRNAPDDWQITNVNGDSRFWVRARVVNEYTVAPVGTQLTAITKCKDITIVRGAV